MSDETEVWRARCEERDAHIHRLEEELEAASQRIEELATGVDFTPVTLGAHPLKLHARHGDRYSDDEGNIYVLTWVCDGGSDDVGHT